MTRVTTHLIDEAARRYQAGVGIPRIAILSRVSEATLRRHLRARGVMPPATPRERGYTSRLTTGQLAAAIAAYVDGAGIRRVGQMLDLPYSTTRTLLLDHGVTLGAASRHPQKAPR